MVEIAKIWGVIGIVEYDIRKVLTRRLGGFPEFVGKNGYFLMERISLGLYHMRKIALRINVNFQLFISAVIGDGTHSIRHRPIKMWRNS